MCLLLTWHVGRARVVAVILDVWILHLQHHRAFFLDTQLSLNVPEIFVSRGRDLIREEHLEVALAVSRRVIGQLISRRMENVVTPRGRARGLLVSRAFHQLCFSPSNPDLLVEPKGV